MANWLSMMPGRAIPKQEDGAVWNGLQDEVQMLSAGLSIQERTATDQFLTSLQIKGAIESGFGATRIDPNHGSLSTGCPDTHSGGLQIHPGFVLGQNGGMRSILCNIH